MGDSCNIIDRSEDTSIKNCHVVGSIGSFSTTNTMTRGHSEPFARFKFMDTLSSPYDGGGIINIGEGSKSIKEMGQNDPEKKKGNPLLYDLELLMKAAAVSPDYYKRFVLMKMLATMFQKVGAGMDIRNKIIDEKNQNNDGSVVVDESSGGFLGKWFGAASGGDNSGYKNIARNKAVERLYPYDSTFPAGEGGFTFLPSAYSGSGGVAGATAAQAAAQHSLAGFHFWTHIKDDEQFIAQCGTGNPWIGCIYKLGSGTDTLVNDISEERVYKTIKFLSANFGRYYYSVGGVGSGGVTEKPALITQRKVGGRSYAGAGPSWVFSDLAVSDSPYSALWEFTRQAAEHDEKDWTAADYKIKKMGQSSPSIVFLPSDVVSPSQRTFNGDGYEKIQSIYDYIRYFPEDKGYATMCSENQSEASSQEYTDVSSFSQFVVEVYGTFSSTGIQKYTTTPREGFTARGGVITSSAMSLSSEAYGTINDWRTSCEDGYRYPTDLDCGILLYELYSGGTEGIVEDPPAFTDYSADTIEEMFSVKGGTGFEGDGDGIGAFIIQTPNSTPQNPPQLAEWGGDIEPDFMDLQLYKVALPFSLAQITNRIRLGYSYALDDRLLTFRSSCIPNGSDSTRNATSFDVRDVSFDVSELQPQTNNFGTEFPKCGEADSVINLQGALKNLDAMMRSYVDVQLEPAVSYDYTVAGFGFGDDNFLPSVYGGLESISVSLGANGTTTKIKIGNKRRARASDEMRKTMIISELAGVPMARTRQGSVSTTFSNHFLTST